MDEQTKAAEKYTFDELVDMLVVAFKRQLGPNGINIFPEGSKHTGREAWLLMPKSMIYLKHHTDNTYEVIYCSGNKEVMSVKADNITSCAYPVVSWLLDYVPLPYTLEKTNAKSDAVDVDAADPDFNPGASA